jgi:hypothetical protein
MMFADSNGLPERLIGVAMDVTQRKRSEQTARFLADASASLAVLVDFDSTLQKVASLAVPYFADWATVDMVESEETLRRVAVAHVDPSKVALGHEVFRRFPADPNEPHGTWNVVHTDFAHKLGGIPTLGVRVCHFSHGVGLHVHRVGTFSHRTEFMCKAPWAYAVCREVRRSRGF